MVMKKQLVVLLGMLLTANLMYAQKQKRDFGKTPEDSVECVKNISLYAEFYKQKNYKDASVPWRKAVEICPKASKNHYIKGVNIYRYFIKSTKDEEAKNKYLDTLIWIYDKRYEFYGQKGYVLGRKGVDIARFGSSDRYMEAYEALGESFQLQGNKMEAAPLATYYQVAYSLVKMEKLETEVLLDLFPKLTAVVQANATSKKAEAYQSANEQLEKIFSSVASCPDLVAIYQPKFEANPSDTALLKQILGMFEKRDCTSEELFLQASMELDKVQPSGTSKLGIGIALLKKERFKDAVGYLTEAGSIATDDDTKKSAFKYAASGNLALRNYPAVKTNALKLIQLDPNSGEAYMLIGDAYLYGTSSVGDNECNKRGGALAAIDKYSRAKQLDPSLAEKINRKLGTAASQYPKKEDCFFHGITEGQQITIGGWINETVTVRVRD